MRQKRRVAILLLSLTASLVMTAADERLRVGDGTSGIDKQPSGIWRTVMVVKTYIDSSAVKGCDPDYIMAPRRPWQVMVRSNVNQTDLKTHADVLSDNLPEDEELDGKAELMLDSRIKTKPSTYVGLWAGYRGYGLGYQKYVAGDKGSLFTIGATGGSYGLNLRLHTFKAQKPEIRMHGWVDDGEGYHEEMNERMTYTLAAPMRIRTLLVDGYYLFNGSRFSYAAAFDQSVIQRRSAGSFIAGAMYYHASMKSDNDHNADYIYFNNNVGRLRQTQLSLGAGYAYNWVPARGWLVSALAMPMFTLYDHLELTRYDSDYRQQMLDEEGDGPSIMDLVLKDWHLTPTRTEKSTSTCRLNFDTRLSLTYQLEESLFVNVYGQFYNFRIRNSGLHGRLNDWAVYASIGIRL